MVKIVIVLRGGLVEQVIADGENVEYIVADLDTEGAGDDEISQVFDDSEDAVLSGGTADFAAGTVGDVWNVFSAEIAEAERAGA